jgi:SAM-dependent methyltransferase
MALLRLFPQRSEQGVKSSGTVEPTRTLADLEKENEDLKAELAQYRIEKRMFERDTPFTFGDRRIAEIVPPIPGAPLRATVGWGSMAGYLASSDCWHGVLSRFLKDRSRVLDIGCGCGKMARTLLNHPYVTNYIGFDVYKPSIDWSRETIVPLSGARFQFHWIDVFSAPYNPGGTVRGTEVAFPAEDGAIELAFACSLFTHLLEDDARHYLREVRRVLVPGGLFLPSIHINPEPGTDYSGDEGRIDINPDYFVQLAQDAGLRLSERLGDLHGQDAFLFTAG